MIKTSQQQGVSVRRSCVILVIEHRRIVRWQQQARQGQSLANLTPGPQDPLHRMLPEEIDQIVAMAKSRVSLIDCFEGVPDPRVKSRCDHDLVDVLVIALCTLLCGGDNFNDMEEFGSAKEEWFKTFLKLRNGIPTHDTFNRVFAMIRPEAFLEMT